MPILETNVQSPIKYSDSEHLYVYILVTGGVYYVWVHSYQTFHSVVRNQGGLLKRTIPHNISHFNQAALKIANGSGEGVNSNAHATMNKAAVFI